MSNCMLGFPVWSDAGPSQTPTYGSGSWLAALPVSNIADRRLSKVARSTDATAANTKLRVDLGTARAVGVVAVLIPNLTKTSTPTIQWKGGTTAGGTDVYNPGAVTAWPTGIVAEDVTSWDGTIMNVWLTAFPNSTARHWELDIVDTANADGYLDVARVIIAGSTGLSVTLDDGAQMGVESNTTSEDTDGGATLYSSKRRRRNDKFNISNLTNADALGTLHKMMFSLGTSGQVFWVPDPADTTYGWKRNYLGVLKELSPLQGNSTRWNTAFSVREEL
jgi:hypothetical protein